jgi:hypothetical protein
MAEPKTIRTDGDVQAFLRAVPDPRRRGDALAVCELITRATGEQPALWGPSIVGFGHRVLRYDNGREQDWMVVGFSPRKQATTLYFAGGLEEYADLLGRLGRHSTGKGCLYLKRLADVDLDVLTELVTRSVERHRAPGGGAGSGGVH